MPVVGNQAANPLPSPVAEVSARMSGRIEIVVAPLPAAPAYNWFTVSAPAVATPAPGVAPKFVPRTSNTSPPDWSPILPKLNESGCAIFGTSVITLLPTFGVTTPVPVRFDDITLSEVAAEALPVILSSPPYRLMVRFGPPRRLFKFAVPLSSSSNPPV